VIIPVSAVIATRDRAASLSRTLDSLLLQGIAPREFVAVDASKDEQTRNLLSEFQTKLPTGVSMRWFAAKIVGAAPQRNEGVAQATQPFIWFLDDDIRFEPNCVERLWNAIESDRRLGGVNAMIINQRYQTPGAVSRFVFTLMNGRAQEGFAGRVIGPAINLLPEDRDELPEVVPVEWLNTTCTIYRRQALPSPPFDSRFVGYSLMEDVTLSLRVAQRGWKLANRRTARIFHDSQPGEHKSDLTTRAAMEVENRAYVMTRILGKTKFFDYVRLAIWELFSTGSGCLSPGGRRNLWRVLLGKWNGFRYLKLDHDT
jgi:GT2 family glycosyltransferase